MLNEQKDTMVRSAARVLDVLEYLAGTNEGASLKEVSSTLSLPKSSTLMLLRTLVARGYATRDEADRYMLNDLFKAHGFGWGGNRHARLIALANPIMEALSREIGETIILGVLERNMVTALTKVVSEQDIRWDVSITEPSRLYCSAMGRAMIAFSPEERQRSMLLSSPLESMTPHTVTDIDELLKLIFRVREDGFAVSEEEYALGGTGVAAPVFARDGSVVAALNAGCVTGRYRANREQIIQSIKKSAELLSQRVMGNADD